jgi:hypothetical protein
MDENSSVMGRPLPTLIATQATLFALSSYWSPSPVVWYYEAAKAFTAVTENEPSCAMGYWGIAMSHRYPLLPR